MKCKLTSLCAVLILCSIFLPAYSQTLQVTGRVTKKATGEALAAATVSLKGSGAATQTDDNGNYSISLPAGGGTLVASYTGMGSVEQRVTRAGQVNFELADDVATLADLVIVGYGTQKITKVSGAIATVKAADIERLKPQRTEEALQGRASGVNVIQSGSPGSTPTVLVRGIPSFSGTDPVVIIDGVPQTLGDLNSVNPSDIESISVLKDAATTAIYGVKGGNGVIVVTTKGGRKGQRAEVTFGANYGMQEVMNKIPVLNATEYAAIINEGSTVAGGNVIFPDLTIFGKGTDWQDQIFERAPIQTHTLGLRGGSDRMTYYLSGGFQGQGGIVGGYDKSRFNRGTFTANLSFDLSRKLKFLLNTTGVMLESKGIQENSFNSIIGSALNFDPTVPVLNTVPNTPGKYGFSNLLLSEIFNPLTKLDNTYNKNIGSKLFGKFELQYEVFKNFKLSSRFGYTKYDDNSKSFTPLVFYGPLNVENTMLADGSAVTDRHNSVTHNKTSNFNYTWETFGNYNFRVNEDHNFETVLGMSFARIAGHGMSATRQDVPFNSWEFADFSAATGSNTATNSNARDGSYYQYFRKNMSYFGRVNYDFKDRYLASFSARRDGSYAFGVDNKFANFYSGSLGWIVSQENFFNADFINFLKVRGSYGSIGNENVSPQFVSISTGGPSYGNPPNSNGYTFNNVFYPGSTVGSAANTALRWEEQRQLNVGFDITVLKNKISFSGDYFRKDVEGLLFTPNVSSYLGTVPVPTANIGSTKSAGIDLSLTYTETIGKSFKLINGFTFTTAKNEVTATNQDGTAKILGGYYFNGQSQSVTVFEKGFTPGYFYGYKTDGLFQNEAQIRRSPVQGSISTLPGGAKDTVYTAKPGDIKYVDVNGDGVISSLDQTKIGDPFPTFTMGWNLGFDFKNFDFNMFTYASVGNDIYRAYERNAIYSNKFRSILGRWTGEGSTNDATTPRFTFDDANSNIRVSDRYVEDGSFIKIKNIQLGYTFTQPGVKKVFKGLRLYAQVKNALTLTEYSGYDPEISGAILNTGVDRGAYPQARTYAVGVDVKL
ncbi:MAG: TonB-dependent receptor [Chitinophagaceae bacterium]|nr:MAG: TonB-dependent receptor [Chitinophagaceae bacterium]